MGEQERTVIDVDHNFHSVYRNITSWVWDEGSEKILEVVVLFQKNFIVLIGFV